MKRKKLKTGIQAVIMTGLVVFFIACNNSDYTRGPADKDTAANNSSVTDTSARTSMNKGAMKKKGKVTIGSMTNKEAEMKADKTGVYNIADVMPAYPGGHSALENYMNNSIEYPQTAIDNNSQGTVDVQFVVDENGNVSDAKMIGKGLGNGLDEEAVKVVSNMPKWTPGKVKGKNVKTRMILPVTYKLEE